MPKPLAIIPTFVTQMNDTEVCRTTVRTLRETVGDSCDVLLVDDGSPESDLVNRLRGIAAEWDCELVAKERNEGFAKTVNIGLYRALGEQRDAVLVNADMEFTNDRWLVNMAETQDDKGPAPVVGALLLYPHGLIQHAGIFFSLLTREFEHFYRYGPGLLPEAHVPKACPVTGALQYVRHDTLRELGVYDERFFLGFEDVDYCLRVFDSGRQCIYNPEVTAVHHESFFRGRPSRKIADWQARSWLYLAEKWGSSSFNGTTFAQFLPELV